MRDPEDQSGIPETPPDLSGSGLGAHEDLSRFDPPPDPDETFTSRWLGRRHRPDGSGGRTAVVIGVLLLLAGFGWWWFTVRTPGDPAFQMPTAVASPPTEGEEVEPLELPPLAESDGFIRDVVSALSSHPEWTSWMVNDALVDRFVVSVVNVANGGSPSEHVDFLAPSGDFEVRAGPASEAGAAGGGGGAAPTGETIVTDPASYDRYDLLTTVVSSLDTQGSARLYRQLKPLLDEAYQALGFPDGDFDTPLAEAIAVIVGVQVPTGPVALVAKVERYEFADPELEALTPAEKHVIRLGPENAALIQGKLRELANALDLDLIAPGQGG